MILYPLLLSEQQRPASTAPPYQTRSARSQARTPQAGRAGSSGTSLVALRSGAPTDERRREGGDVTLWRGGERHYVVGDEVEEPGGYHADERGDVLGRLYQCFCKLFSDEISSSARRE